MRAVTDDEQAALIASAVGLAVRAEAEPDPERAAHLAAGARDLAEVLDHLAGSPAARSREGGRSPFVQALREQARAARAKAAG